MDTKHVIISGGSKGLGLAITRRLLDAGFDVHTFSRGPNAETKALEETHAATGRYHWSGVDVTDYGALEKFVDGVSRGGGQIVGLVNNAGANLDKLLPMTAPDEVRRLISVNLVAPLLLTRLVSRSMIQKGGGSIINISSIIGHRGIKGTSVYSATKSALIGFSRSLARELGARNIRVNALLPGYIETDMTASMQPAKKQQVIRRTPLGRLGNVADIAGVVEFLLSDNASFITGQTIVVDGGLTC